MNGNRMRVIDDVMLVAFVDGELPPEDAFAVQEALRDDEELQDRVRVMREGASILRAAYGRIAHERLPVDLVRMVAEAPAAPRLPAGQAMGTAGSPAGSHAGSHPGNQPGGHPGGPGAALAPAAVRRRSAWGPMAMAASVALVVGVAGGWLGAGLRGGGTHTTNVAFFGDVPSGASALVQRALEKEVSGTAVSWTDPGSRREFTVQPMRTFRDPARGFCREYRETSGVADTASPQKARTVYGLACRSAEGVWNVEYYLLPGEAAHRL
jgi:surface antigen